MTSKPRIAVACNRDPASPGAVPVAGVLETYADALIEGGSVPFLLPATDDAALLSDYLDMADGLFMPGGIDVDPLVFGEGPDANIGRLDPGLDRFQIALIRLARTRGTPILGVCRGVQVMNVAFGGTLFQHLGNREATFNHRQTMHGRWPSHKARAVPGSLIERVFGRDFAVNSFHHQAAARVAPGFAVTALSPDGVVEALEARNGPFCVGVQWHPERMIHSLPETLKIFKVFAAAAGDFAAAR